MLDFDDTHPATVIPPTAPVAPPALALAELHRLAGRDLLHAFILGAEVECRIGLAVSPEHYARGWHITSTCGVFGAAAACARLLRLSPAQTAAALSLAASQSAGIVENLASSGKNVSMGYAARNGLLAALLARGGFDGAPTALEGRLGWARAMGDAPDVGGMTGELGERWEFAANTYKPYPSGIVFHAVVDACLRLRARLRGASPAAVLVRGNQLLLDRGDRPTMTARDARVSIAHNAATALLRGTATVADFSMEAVDDPALAALRRRVTAELDADLPPAAASVTVRLQDGSEFFERVDDPVGSRALPLTDAALEAKFTANAPARSDERIASVWGVDRLEDVTALMSLMASSEVEGCP